jgi:hypothetical protein
MNQFTPLYKDDYLPDALLEILGKQELSALGQKEKIAIEGTAKEKIIHAMVDVYGENLARGILIRAGRAGFYYWMKGNAEQFGWQTSDFRLLPTRAKIKTGLNDLVNWWKDQRRTEFSVESSSSDWQITCSARDAHLTGLECCYFLGIFQEFFSWAGSGKFYPAVETEISRNDTQHHVLNISKQPLD